MYKFAKYIHLWGLIMWLGPSTGGFVLLTLARQGHDPAYGWLLKNNIYLIYIEALGLVTLIASGAVMRSAGGLQGARWLRKKLTIALPVFVPLEAAQIYIYRFIVLKSLDNGPLAARALLVFDRFNELAFLALLLTVPVVFYFAVFKPGDRG